MKPIFSLHGEEVHCIRFCLMTPAPPPPPPPITFARYFDTVSARYFDTVSGALAKNLASASNCLYAYCYSYISNLLEPWMHSALDGIK